MKYQDWQLMNKEKKMIPELRFPEFKNDGEWEYLNGNKLFKPISNKNHNSDLPILAITQDQGAIPRELIDYHVSVSEKSIKGYKVVEIGDFIISLRSFQGGIEYSEYLGLCSPAYIILRKKLDVLNDFYRHYFKSFPFIQDLNRNLEGIRDGKMISYKQFSDILIPKPKKKEQRKIADCLSSLDELIASHKDRLESLKNHKKGLMQNLFPQEGQKAPNYRFPEFEKDGEWVEKELGQLGSLINGLTYKPRDVMNEGLLVLRSSNIRNNIIDLEDCVFVNPKIKGAKLTEPNDILICVRNGSKRLIGKNALIPDDIPKATHGAFMTVFRAKYPEFVFQLFQTYTYRKQVKADLGATINSINGKNLIKYTFFVPKPKEQLKIANCLSSVDFLITAQHNKINQLERHKRGLLQRLFLKVD